MTTTSEPRVVVYHFEKCRPYQVVHAVMAAVDQLCAAEDVAVSLLDSIDYPLGETLDALEDYGPQRVAVSIEQSDLVLEIELTAAFPTTAEMLGSSRDVVQAFFDVTFRPNAVQLRGALR